MSKQLTFRVIDGMTFICNSIDRQPARYQMVISPQFRKIPPVYQSQSIIKCSTFCWRVNLTLNSVCFFRFSLVAWQSYVATSFLSELFSNCFILEFYFIQFDSVYLIWILMTKWHTVFIFWGSRSYFISFYLLLMSFVVLIEQSSRATLKVLITSGQ